MHSKMRAKAFCFSLLVLLAAQYGAAYKPFYLEVWEDGDPGPGASKLIVEDEISHQFSYKEGNKYKVYCYDYTERRGIIWEVRPYGVQSRSTTESIAILHFTPNRFDNFTTISCSFGPVEEFRNVTFVWDRVDRNLNKLLGERAIIEDRELEDFQCLTEKFITNCASIAQHSRYDWHYKLQIKSKATSPSLTVLAELQQLRDKITEDMKAIKEGLNELKEDIRGISKVNT